MAVACTDLAEGIAWVKERLGVAMQPGGKHVLYGTHNALLGMGDIYLEVIAPDPDAAPYDGPRWFNLDRFTGPPRLANWICRTDHFDPIAGPPRALSRGDLRWQITVPDDGSLPYGGAFPTLIQWGEGMVTPAESLPDSGARLTQLTIFHPDPDLPGLVAIDDARVAFATGPFEFEAVIETASGPVTLR
ncbi:VOC family protein [Yoonia sp. 2307UL14-13]|uniref:VOC family protein n=1 Tax=Yoonia sp. 2307UL14-13 TaxID=3126506 RepID=UPI0030A76248